ncbi:MAG: chromosomal replication initiator protein DnaA [Candidatus Dependentiae bacterium]|nr:chromosomal replication initiator protein DnaA [Candidatus Dependentiae bacterium]
MDIVWQEFLTIIREEVGSRVVDTWFKAVSFRRWDMLLKEVYLEAPNAFVKDWLHKNYLILCQTHLARLLNVATLKVIISDVNEIKNSVSEHVVISTAEVKQEVVLYKPVKMAAIKRGNYTNGGYSFDNFVMAPSNSLAYAAAHAVAENPGQIYNPLFIYGESGLGKTHLLHAIGGAIKNRHQKAVVLYQTTDRFVSEFINAIRFNKVHQFEAKYQSADVLLIDDVQFISNKGQTQEAFFHIFNLLHDAHKQIVVSSDTFPQKMEGIAERLRSRFAWGLVTDIYAPSLETKVAILKKKAELSSEIVNDNVLHFIAEHVTSNIRELEGALVRIIAFATITQQPITLDLAHKVLLRMVVKKPRVVDFEAVVKVINKHYSCNSKDLFSKSRNKHISFVRHVAMYCMKHFTDKSFRDIALFFGGRDHTCVVYALSKIERHIKENVHFGLELRRIESELLQ